MRSMKKGYFTPPVLIILAIIIFAVAIVIAINTDLVKRIQKEPSPTPSLSPTARQTTPSPDETANWKTYANPKVGFSIKYPPNTTLTESIGENNVGTVDLEIPEINSKISI